MRKVGVAVLLAASAAAAQDVKETCPTAVKRDCRAQLDEMKKSLPSIVIRVIDKNRSDIAHGAVTLDGRVLEIDPSTHKVHVERSTRARQRVKASRT